MCPKITDITDISRFFRETNLIPLNKSKVETHLQILFSEFFFILSSHIFKYVQINTYTVVYML